ncbi:MAG: PT domain-containing protein [Clostridia bacterium]|nr:PT domain-containing protein [Clostridia bacterium]
MKSDKIIDAIGNINESMINVADGDIAPGSGRPKGSEEKQSRKTGAIAGIIAAVVVVAGISTGIFLGHRANQRKKDPTIINSTDEPQNTGADQTPIYTDHVTEEPVGTQVPTNVPDITAAPTPTSEPVISGDAAIAPLKSFWYEVDNIGLSVPMTYKEFLSYVDKMDLEGRSILKLCGDPAEIPADQSGKYELECDGFTGRFYRIFTSGGQDPQRNVVRIMIRKDINGSPSPLGIKIEDSLETVLTKLGLTDIGELTQNLWVNQKRSSYSAVVDGTKIEMDISCGQYKQYYEGGLSVVMLVRMEEPVGDEMYHAKNASFVFTEEQGKLVEWSIMAALDRNEYRDLPLNVVPTPAPTEAPTPGNTEAPTPGHTEAPSDTFSIVFVDNKLHVNESSMEVSVMLSDGLKANSNEGNKLIKFVKDALEGKAKKETDTFKKIKSYVNKELFKLRLIPYGSDSGYDLYYNVGSTAEELWIVDSAKKTCIGSVAFTDEEYNSMMSAITAEAFKTNGSTLLKAGNITRVHVMDSRHNEKWLHSAEQIERMKQLISALRITDSSERDPSGYSYDWSVAIWIYYEDGSVSELKTNGYVTWLIDNKTLLRSFSDESYFYFFDSFEDETRPEDGETTNDSPFVIARSGSTFRFERIDTVPKVVLKTVAAENGETLDNTNGRITEFVRNLLEGKSVSYFDYGTRREDECEFWFDFVPQDGSRLYGYRMAYNFKRGNITITDIIEDNTFAMVSITEDDMRALVNFMIGSVPLELPYHSPSIDLIDIKVIFYNKEFNRASLKEKAEIDPLMDLFSSLLPVRSETGMSALDGYTYELDIWCSDRSLWKVTIRGSVIEVDNGSEKTLYHIFIDDYRKLTAALDLIVPIN